MLSLVDLEELVQRCRSASARAYIKEAVDCYHIGAHRACVILTWIALVYDFIDKLRELGLAGDVGAAKRVSEFDIIQKKRDTEAALKFEREVLTMAQDEFELITIQEMSDLARLFDDRNRCGHPNLNRETEVYTPPPELARLHLRNAVEHVLQRPPVQGKAALTALQQTVDSDYFPIVVADAEHVLKATPLPRAKENVVREFVLGGLISLMREALPEKRMMQRLAAAQIAERMHPATVKKLLDEKFDDAVFGSPDDSFSRIVWLLVVYQDLQARLQQATWVKLENYVRTMPPAEHVSVLAALRVSRLRDLAINRLNNSSDDELASLVSQVKHAPDSALIDRCTAVYAQAGNFNDANNKAKTVIEPLVQYMTQDQLQATIAAGRNYEVKESFEFWTVAQAVRRTGIVTDAQLAAWIAENGLQERLSSLIPTTET